MLYFATDKSAHFGQPDNLLSIALNYLGEHAPNIGNIW